MQKNTISAAETSVMHRLVFSAFILSILLLNKRILLLRLELLFKPNNKWVLILIFS